MALTLVIHFGVGRFVEQSGVMLGANPGPHNKEKAMWIEIMSRREVCWYCEEHHDEPCVMISISDPRMWYDSSPFVSSENKVVDILELMFSDADKPGLDVYCNEAGVEDLMSDEDARRVAEFVAKYRGENIIVHCDAGISRSAGVAAAIMKHLSGDDSRIFDSSRWHPNMWCYRKTLNALHEKDGPKPVSQ